MPIFALALLVILQVTASAQIAKGGEGGEGPASVVVVNQLDRGVTVWINGELKGEVEPFGEERFVNIPSGNVSLEAGAMGSAGPVAAEERSLSPGQTFTWTLYPLLSWEEERGVGTMVVSNALDREIELSIGGREAGSLAPGASRAFPRIVAGEVEVSARQSDGRVLEARSLIVTPGKIARWEVGRREPEQARPGTPATTSGPIIQDS